MARERDYYTAVITEHDGIYRLNTSLIDENCYVRTDEGLDRVKSSMYVPIGSDRDLFMKVLCGDMPLVTEVYRLDWKDDTDKAEMEVSHDFA